MNGDRSAFAAESLMARRFTGSLAWERFALLSTLVLAGLVLGEMSGAALGAIVCLVLLVTLGVETVRYREELSRLR